MDGFKYVFLDVGYVGEKDDRMSTTGYPAFVRGNLIMWMSKKKDVISQSSVEA